MRKKISKILKPFKSDRDSCILDFKHFFFFFTSNIDKYAKTFIREKLVRGSVRGYKKQRLEVIKSSDFSGVVAAIDVLS